MRGTGAERSLPEREHPPRARLAFRVGIVGHRPNKLPDAAELHQIREIVGLALAVVRQTVLDFHAGAAAGTLYRADPPLLRAVSPLAEGADRILAEEAVALGYALCCVMPFHQAEYEADFAPDKALEPDSLDRFRGLLRAAAGPGLVKFELDGAPSHRAAAYGAAGRVVLNQSDLLIAVWNGREGQGGGTYELMREAARFRVPLLWIDAEAPYGFRVIRGADELPDPEIDAETRADPDPPTDPVLRRQAIADKLASIVRAEIDLPPSTGADKPAAELVREYFSERRPVRNWAFFWKLFRDRVGSDSWSRPQLRVADFEQQVAPAWPVDPGGAEPVAGGQTALWINAELRAHYAWSDKLADIFADCYRSTYIGAYLLAALAVFIALLPVAVGWTEANPNRDAVCIGFELLILTLLLWLLWRMQHRCWHQRWMDYRLLAELIRQLRLLIPLGGGRPFPHVQAHLAVYGDPRQSWMHWHVRALARATGLHETIVTPDYVRDCLDHISGLVGDETHGQLGFHAMNHERSERIHERLHDLTALALAATMAGIGLHLVMVLALYPVVFDSLYQALDRNRLGWTRNVVDLLLLSTSAALPALSAAFAGISNQGEFMRISKRAAAMASGFRRFRDQIDTMRDPPGGGPPPSLTAVVPLVRNIAAMMVDEVMDWRVVFTDRATTSI